MDSLISLPISLNRKSSLLTLPYKASQQDPAPSLL